MLSWVMHENSYIDPWSGYPLTDYLEYSNAIPSGSARFANTETILQDRIQ